MDERDIEKGYAAFHRKLNHILRSSDVKTFKAHVAAHPGQAGKLSHCLGLSDELAEIEMVKAILVRSALKDLHPGALEWLRNRGINPPSPRPVKKRRGRREAFNKGGRSRNGRS
ncbi:MAG: hypothetical protein ABII26_08985 [Pseudomonadota bacterium]